MPRTESNAAYERLLTDYTHFHAALVVVGGLFALAILGLAGFSWLRFRRAPRGFERRTCLAFALGSTVFGLLLGLVVAANLSNVLDPRPGLAGAIGTPGDLRPAASTELTKSLESWVHSGTSELPALIAGKVDDRLAWQEPKAVICTVLLVGFVALSVVLWRSAMRRSGSGPRRGRGLFVAAGSASVLASSLLVLMVMGNTQAAYAPVTMTLLFG